MGNPTPSDVFTFWRLKCWYQEHDWCISLYLVTSKSATLRLVQCKENKLVLWKFTFSFWIFTLGSVFHFLTLYSLLPALRRLQISQFLLPNVAHTLAEGCFIWLNSGTYKSLVIKPALGGLCGRDAVETLRYGSLWQQLTPNIIYFFILAYCSMAQWLLFSFAKQCSVSQSFALTLGASTSRLWWIFKKTCDGNLLTWQLRGGTSVSLLKHKWALYLLQVFYSYVYSPDPSHEVQPTGISAAFRRGMFWLWWTT